MIFHNQFNLELLLSQNPGSLQKCSQPKNWCGRKMFHFRWI